MEVRSRDQPSLLVLISCPRDPKSTQLRNGPKPEEEPTIRVRPYVWALGMVVTVANMEEDDTESCHTDSAKLASATRQGRKFRARGQEAHFHEDNMAGSSPEAQKNKDISRESHSATSLSNCVSLPRTLSICLTVALSNQAAVNCWT